MRRLVIGTGNTCRAPMAQALIEAHQHEGDEVRSAGLSVTGVAASVHAVMAMREIGIDLSFHKSPLISPELVAWADEIAVMTPSHKVAVTSLFDVDPDRVIVLGKGIPDPFGLSLTDYRHARDILQKAVREWIAMGTSTRIVPMSPDHIETLAELERACFADPWSAQGLAEELDNPCAHFTVAERGGEIAGYLGTHVVADEMGVTNIAVFERHRRRGVAHALLHDARQYACEHRLSRITLEVRVSNADAIALYESEGFVKDGIRPRFYTHPTEDAAIYSLYFPCETEGES